MGHHNEQGEAANVGHLLVAIAVTIALPLLPAILGWLAILSK